MHHHPRSSRRQPKPESLDNHLVYWLIYRVKIVGLFEAKTRFSQICRQVAKTGEEVLVTNHGRPISRICPPRSPNSRTHHGILHDLRAFEKKHGPLPSRGNDFPEVWLHRSPARQAADIE